MNILIVYTNNSYPIRATIRDHIYSFRRYSKHNCFYLNLALRSVPAYLARVSFDLIIFHTTFLSNRWIPSVFEELRRKALPLRKLKAVKVALPQDEFIHTGILCDFINEFEIDRVFSVAPASEWEKIYDTVDRRKVKFEEVLTGYLDDSTIGKINRMARKVGERTIDVGYRAWRAAAWLGRHGKLKVAVSDLFQERAPAKGIVVDVSTREEDTILGDGWYEFLLKCKYMIGVEGGASILDRDGRIKQKTEEYMALHPQAGFEEIESACFPNLDGSLRLMALSPRNLEACATRTCQVLVEGEYNGVLKPGEHYIELKRDFGNIDEVLEIIKRDAERAGIIERAYAHVVASGLYTYRSFVEFITEKSLAEGRTDERVESSAAANAVAHLRMRLSEAVLGFRLGVVNPMRVRLRLRSRARSILGGGADSNQLRELGRKRGA